MNVNSSKFRFCKWPLALLHYDTDRAHDSVNNKTCLDVAHLNYIRREFTPLSHDSSFRLVVYNLQGQGRWLSVDQKARFHCIAQRIHLGRDNT